MKIRGIMNYKPLLFFLSVIFLQNCSTDIVTTGNENHVSWISQIDTLCQTDGIEADSVFVELCNKTDADRFFNNNERYGPFGDYTINSGFSTIMQDLINQVLLRAAAGKTKEELKQYFSSCSTSDTLVTLLSEILQKINSNCNIVTKQSLTGLSTGRYNRNFINFLHCIGYQLDTVPFWVDSLKRIEINFSTEIIFSFDTDKLLCNRKTGVFYHENKSRKVDMATISGILPVFENEYFRVTKIVNRDNTLELELILPKSEYGLKVVNDSAVYLTDFPFKSESVTFNLPICKYQISALLVSLYKHYNVDIPFSKSEADFSEISDSECLYVEDIYNLLELQWNESGVNIYQTGNIQFNEHVKTAHNGTSYAGETTSYSLNIFEFPIDCYPFVFIVRERYSNRIVFFGKLVDP